MPVDISTLADHCVVLKHQAPLTQCQKSKDMRFCDVCGGILVEGFWGMFGNCNPWKKNVRVKCEVYEERIFRICGV